jgi:hypothetical protein
MGMTVPGSRRGYIVGAPATWDLSSNLAISFCLWGALWFSIVVVSWQFLYSAVWTFSCGVFFVLLSFWLHCGGSSFSSSPVEVTGAMGSLHQPCLGGSACLAIALTVSRKVPGCFITGGTSSDCYQGTDTDN